jgi:hypothetical protein
MTRTVKFVLLFIALLLPGLVYVFLKGFGRNEFDVPALYQDAVPSVAGCEGYSYSAPYSAPDTVLASMGVKERRLVLVVFEPERSRAGIERVQVEFSSGGFAFVEVPESMRSSAACALILQPPSDLVVVDEKLLIRGQYDMNNRKEVDRLIVELKILLKQY